MLRIIQILILGFLFGNCCSKPNKYFNINFLDVSNFNIPSEEDDYLTPSGVKFSGPEDLDIYWFAEKLDKAVLNLEECTGFIFSRNKFRVHIPNTVYKSTCTGKFLLPVAADPQQCRDKGLLIPIECEWVAGPTEACLCPCSYRAVIQGNRVIVVTSDLEVFKHELLSMKLDDRYLWDSEYSNCLGSDSFVEVDEYFFLSN